MKTLIAYDGSLNAKTALRYGIQKVREKGGEIVLIHVFNSSMFVDYEASPQAKDVARTESARYLEDARRIIEERAKGIQSRIIMEEGDPTEEIVRYAKSENIDIIFCPPSYKSITKLAPCPVSIIPGYIILPLDNTDIAMPTLDRVKEEAKATGSKVILLGIVPIHIYNKWERTELEKVKRATSLVLKNVKKMLDEHAVETKELIRSGYPDEEIVKVADEYPVSMIIMPAEGNEPSELSKAAAILLDRDSATTNNPLVLMETTS
jgi:nucleotide-binding universal stress UspA family protein